MALSKHSIGEYIELVLNTNNGLMYGPNDVVGVTITKEIIPTKANVTDTDLSKFIVVQPGDFVYNPRTHGKKIGFGYNDTDKTYLISWNNIAFRIKENKKSELLADYLFLHFSRNEWDREACYRSWGSSTEVFSWEALREMKIEVPSLSIQQKYVDIYKAMIANQQDYERGLEDLKLVCDSTVESFKRMYPIKSFGKYVRRVDERNKRNEYRNVKNVSVTKEFSEVSSKVNRSELAGYKIVRPRQIAFVQTTHNEHVFCNALNNTDDIILVTSVNEVFECDEQYILPEYLCINFNRPEFDRYARFHSWGSARETFAWSDLVEVKIPIPPIEVQRALADLFRAYRERKLLSQKLKDQINDICPILVKGSIDEAQKEA